jgi:hypothetical protein
MRNPKVAKLPLPNDARIEQPLSNKIPGNWDRILLALCDIVMGSVPKGSKEEDKLLQKVAHDCDYPESYCKGMLINIRNNFMVLTPFIDRLKKGNLQLPQFFEEESALPPVLPLTYDMMPKGIWRDFTVDRHRRTNTPYEYIAGNLVTAVGNIIARRYAVFPFKNSDGTQDDSQYEYPNHWNFNAGGVNFGKSRAASPVSSLVRRIDQKLGQIYQRKYARYKKDVLIWNPLVEAPHYPQVQKTQ